MIPLTGSQSLIQARAGVQADIGATLRAIADQIGGAIQRYANSDRVPVDRLTDIQAVADNAIDDGFLGPDGRPFGHDGVTGQAPIPRALNHWYASAVLGAVLGYSQYIRANTPDAVQTWLLGAKKPTIIKGFVGMHDWVDPNGLILSDRIWQAAIRTRLKLRGILAAETRRGTSALTLSRRIEQFLVPGRAAIRTTKPYGTDASFDAIRLGRTEISRGHGQATIAAARRNPYVTKIAWRLSASHPRMDICDDHAANGPYDPDDVPLYPSHPHELCYLVPMVTSDPADVVAQMQDAMDAGYEPPYTPMDGPGFAEWLIGGYLVGLVTQRLGKAA